MTLEQKKANELIEKFKPKCSGNSQEILNTELAKQCAVILCNEVIKEAVLSHRGNFFRRVKEELLKR